MNQPRFLKSKENGALYKKLRARFFFFFGKNLRAILGSDQEQYLQEYIMGEIQSIPSLRNVIEMEMVMFKWGLAGPAFISSKFDSKLIGLELLDFDTS